MLQILYNFNMKTGWKMAWNPHKNMLSWLYRLGLSTNDSQKCMILVKYWFWEL